MPQLQDQRETTLEEGGPMAIVLKQARRALVPRKALPPPQLGSQANCVCSHLLRPPLSVCPSPQGP